MKTLYPVAWADFMKSFAESVTELESIQRDTKRGKEKIDKFIRQVRVENEASVHRFDIPDFLSEEVKHEIKKTLASVQKLKGNISENLDQLIDDYRHAEENEDRFVVLVFGEVNSGKSALANHVAGLDFDLPAESKGVCFEGEKIISRLAEQETECTKDYQGFRMPGLLWIDCPGVLSTTLANSNKAHRLVSRADIIILVSSSDNPIKLSELKELRKLIELSGNEKIDACVVITKVDRFDEDETPEGRIIRKVMKKDKTSWQGQEDWCNEQLKKSGLKKYLRISIPQAVSIYVARDRMKRDWVSGEKRGNVRPGWEKEYAESGMPDLYRTLTEMLQKHGRTIKKSWPEKRMRGFRGRLDKALKSTEEEVKRLHSRIENARNEFAALKEFYVKEVQEKTASNVADVLVKHNIRKSVVDFDKEAAQTELNKVLSSAVKDVIQRSLAVDGILTRIDNEMKKAFESFCNNEKFNFNTLRDEYKSKTYESSAKSESVGSGIGGAGGAIGGFKAGAAAGAAIGTAFPGIGTAAGAIVGGLLGSVFGGLLGKWGGKKVAPIIHKEKVQVKIKIGTNFDDIIKSTTRDMKNKVKSVIDEIIKYILKYYFDNVLVEINKMKEFVERLKKSVNTIS